MIVGFDLARGATSLLVRYVAAMRVDPGFVARLLGRPSEVWEFIDVNEEFVSLNSCPIGIERPRSNQQSIAAAICNNATGWFSPADPSKSRRMTDPEAKRHLLELVAKNIETFALQGPLVAQLAGVLASRNNRLIDAVYSDLRGAGVPLPELVGPTFEVSDYVVGPDRMQCEVSFSLDNPDKYSVAIQGPGGLSHAFRTAPANCRRLFLWDRDEVLNPQKGQASRAWTPAEPGR